MEAEVVTLLRQDLEFIKRKVIDIDVELEEIHDDLHQVRPEYLEKLERIKKEPGKKFTSKEEFLDYLEHEL
ncbi:MAG: hypothetical protein AABX13_03615 [Nanoarchaeota archaeon]|mgnify:CR=1 FL=1